MIRYVENDEIGSEQLNALFASSWDGHVPRDFTPVLKRSAGQITAYDGEQLVGFINVVWDGGCHAFLLDTTVLPSHRGQGIGSALVDRAVHFAAASLGVEWVHVDFAERLAEFYLGHCGFRSTAAGLIQTSQR